MAFKKVKKEVFEIDCDQCGHRYSTFEFPNRCGGCKCRTLHANSDKKGKRRSDAPAPQSKTAPVEAKNK
jgi:hypothetical protein